MTANGIEQRLARLEARRDESPVTGVSGILAACAHYRADRLVRGSGAGIEANRMALDALLDGLPTAFADHPDADPDALRTAAEWVSL